MVEAIHDGTLASAPTQADPIFGIQIVTQAPNVPAEILIPEHTWTDKAAFATTATKLAGLFIENFKKFESGANGGGLSRRPENRVVNGLHPNPLCPSPQLDQTNGRPPLSSIPLAVILCLANAARVSKV